LPDSLSFSAGAIISCGAQTTYNALKSIELSEKDDLVVFGLGPLGLCGIAIGKAMGAKVAGIGRRKERLKIAKEYGADAVLDIDKFHIPADTINGNTLHKEKLRQIITAKTNELRKNFPGLFNAVYETTGDALAQHEMLLFLRYDGRVATIAWNANIPTGPMVGRAITVKGSFVMPRSMSVELVNFLVEKKVDLDRMITHRFSIEESPQAFRTADSKECGKVIAEWN
jgi:propanol-preferring alcohol dehydrogenase